MKFSVLISIYHKEKDQYFDRAMKSIWDDQSIKPNEIVLVQDGQLTDTLHSVINKWKDKLGNILKVISLKENVGLGEALNVGLSHCDYELIARMDTDDISLPDRFQKQLEIFKDTSVDVCSAWVGEFEDDEVKIVSYRRIPEQHNEIVSFAKVRNPVNHPAVMYKKSSVLSAGSYKYRLSQDYHLFVKMIFNGAKFYNIQEPLVNMRIGNELLERRGGLKNAILEANLQREFYRIGFLNFYELVRNISIGFVIRFLPKPLMKLIFKMIRKL